MSESEEQLIQAARDAVSQCNWVVGECASKWVQRYARGRTDADFGQMVGLSGDQIYQRRRVWERFGELSSQYQGLKWSFFYVALNWDDAADCFAWAQEADATVAEMRAWRRAQQGEDLFTESPDAYSEWALPLAVDTSDLPLSPVMDPAEFVPAGEGDRAGLPGADQPGAETMSMVARDSGDGNYAPFNQNAAARPEGGADHDSTVRKKAELTPDQFWKRAAGALQRINKALSDSYMEALAEQPDSVREKLLEAVSQLNEKLQGELV